MNFITYLQKLYLVQRGFNKFVLFGFCLFSFSLILQAQVTSGGLKGHVSIGANPVPNVTVNLENKANGEKFSTQTDLKGNYVFFNLLPGTEYVINFYNRGRQVKREGLVITLGEDQIFDLDFSEIMDEIKLSAQRTSKSNLMGVGTSVGKKTILELPALNRSLGDIAKLTPQANGLSMAGSSNRFNNVTIDGAIANDAFGLGAAALPGGLAGAQPISLDAIQEMRILLSPYSVQYGNFTGGGINAITRSGTNKLEGSAYMFTKNSALVGKDPVSKVATTQFSEYIAGFRLGGPIVKNKLFYFVNYEFLQRNQPTLFNSGEEGAVITRDSAERVREIMKQNFNYDPGGYDLSSLITRNHKALFKLNYNISAKHKLSLRYSFVTAFKNVLERSRQVFTFDNGGYNLHNLQNVVVLELNSFFNSSASNSLIVSATELKDKRFIAGGSKYFPGIMWNTASGNIFIGSNNYAQDNRLQQDIIEITDNFKLNKNNYTFTFGTHNELFLIQNNFTPRKNGFWQSKTNLSIEDLQKLKEGSESKDLFSRYRAAYPTVKDGDLSQFAFAQFSAYAQAEGSYWQNRLKVTLGMRLDIPVFFNKPMINPDFQKQFSFVNNSMPERILYSPRFGFNLDADGKKNIIIRGGAGIFSGRVPLVWLSNIFGNDGIRMANIDERNPNNPFTPDINKIKTLSKSTNFAVNTVDKNFQFPQVLRSNLGLDFKLPGQVYVTLEGIFTKTINNVFYQKIGLTADNNGKEKTTKTPFQSGYSFPNYNNPEFLVNGKKDPNRSYGGGIYNLINTNQGYTYNISAQIRKDFRFPLEKAGIISLMAAYTYSRAFDVSSAVAAIAASGYEYNLVPANKNFNDPPLAISDYELRHRFISTISYTIPYAKNIATTIFFFFRSNSGKPYSLVFNQVDLNGDRVFFNDLLYIPTQAEIQSESETNANDKTKQDINNFINSSAELQAQRGHFIKRNSLQTPWENILDMRILQNFITYVKGYKQTFQISLEIFNLTNLLNNNWGRDWSLPYSGGAAPWGLDRSKKIALQSSTNKEPWTIKNTYNHNFNSRWQIQLGFRYIF